MPDQTLSRRTVLKGLAGGSLALLASSLPLAGCARPAAKAPDFELKFFSAGEYRTMERLAAVMLPGGHGADPAGAYDVARQADALLAGLDPLTQEQFRQFLSVFESVPVLGWKLQVFSAQNDVDAQEYLRAYQHSSIAVLRQGFDGLKRLTIGAYYADPRSWKAIGYDGAAHCVGGTTVVNNAICFDPPARILDLWQREHGVEGMSPADLAPAIAKVRFILNVQKIQAHEINDNARVMLRGAEKIGMKGHLFEHNRTACVQSGFCMVGCSYDRKQNHHITYIPRALSHGATLYPNARVEKLEAGGREVKRAVGKVQNRQTGDFHPLEVKARIFIAAGGAVSTPLLLLQSGLANRSGQVGRNLHCHPTAPVVADMGDEEVHFYRGIPQVCYVEALSDETADTGGFILESISGGPAQASGLFPIWGAKLHAIMTRFNHYAGAFVQVHDTNSGTVTVGRHGVPIVDYTLTEPDSAKLRRGYQALARIYLAAGARHMVIPSAAVRHVRTEADIEKLSALDVSAGKIGILTAHQMGTCRMGEDPRTCVVDSGGKSHDLGNLYVTDSSVFPTSIGVNPQITIASLATHFARRIIRDRAQIFRS